MSRAMPIIRPPQDFQPPSSFLLKDTDIDWWIENAQCFFKKHFRMRGSLRKKFSFPLEVPWKSIVPVYEPAKMSNREAIEFVKSFGIEVYEEDDVDRYNVDRTSKKPTLHFIENSSIPSGDTVGFSPNYLRTLPVNYLNIRTYLIAFVFYREAVKECFDQKTFTWFPQNSLFGNTVSGFWSSFRKQIYLYVDDGDRFNDNRYGARIAISLKSKW